jgi:hypothetical protein
MASKIDSYIIATFARWALDNEYYEKMIQQFNTSDDDYQNSRSDPDAIAISAIQLLFDNVKKSKRNKSELLSKKNLESYQERTTWKHQIVQKPHTRGTIWRNSEISFVFKAYLTDLKFIKELQKNVMQLVKNESLSHSMSIDYWGKNKRIIFNIKMNEMALLEIFAYTCDPKWREDDHGIKIIFEEIMQIIDPEIQQEEKS